MNADNRNYLFENEGLVLLGLAAIVFLMFLMWIFYGSGLYMMSPVQHDLFINMISLMPNQASYVDSILNNKGYISLYEVIELTNHVEKNINELSVGAIN